MSAEKPRERQILFNDQMVRAILEVRKTVTRRVVKPKQAGRITGAAGPGMAAEYLGVDNDGSDCFSLLQCPYGQPGDRLWGREAWAQVKVAQAPGENWVVYRELDNRTDYGGPWRPSIHMPRWASRILLEITAVRVERLHDLSDPDVLAEGCSHSEMQSGDSLVSVLARLWQSTGGDWAANPWVWVVEFKRVTP
ncbi:hypothetical protein I5K48_04220 [Pseudomonas aeruginosa]|nr:hypothetical protein [Pseudomonas aeruginosa]MBH9221562.1 hypothetical protein [Pseudomonas aeruginosa]